MFYKAQDCHVVFQYSAPKDKDIMSLRRRCSCVTRVTRWVKRRYLVILCVGFLITMSIESLVSVFSIATIQDKRQRDLGQLQATVQRLAELEAEIQSLRRERENPTSAPPNRTDFKYGTFKTGPPRMCPEVPLDLNGRVEIFGDTLRMESIEMRHPELRPGGTWTPTMCTPAYKIAILVPYRDREEHLRIFLRHMHPFLQKQYISYSIFVIEQTNFTAFNRGFLLNVGFIEAMATDEFNCFFFHDVDLIPEDDRNIYTCPIYPRLLAVGRSSNNYTLPYRGYYGGVTVMSRRHYLKINGYSNYFFGWGGEDDDVYARIHEKGLIVDRLSPELGRYHSANHTHAQPNNKRFLVMEQNKREHYRDGLYTTQYRLLKLERKKLYTWILAQPV